LRIPDASSPDASPVDPASNLKSADSPAKATEPSPVPEPAGDEVSVGAVALAAANSLEAPDSRTTELRQKVLDGTYRVDSAAVSAKIIDEHLNE
jgi:anti-sigma28 factor (negative regulator of flagellin synthesis)